MQRVQHLQPKPIRRRCAGAGGVVAGPSPAEMPPPPAWQWKSDKGRWSQWASKVDSVLERAYRLYYASRGKSHSKLEVTVFGKSVAIDLAKMTQTSATGRERPIRRAVLPVAYEFENPVGSKKYKRFAANAERAIEVSVATFWLNFGDFFFRGVVFGLRFLGYWKCTLEFGIWGGELKIKNR